MVSISITVYFYVDIKKFVPNMTKVSLSMRHVSIYQNSLDAKTTIAKLPRVFKKKKKNL